MRGRVEAGCRVGGEGGAECGFGFEVEVASEVEIGSGSGGAVACGSGIEVASGSGTEVGRGFAHVLDLDAAVARAPRGVGARWLWGGSRARCPAVLR